ncbi:MAG: nitronate monooxygenase [Bacteroidales bacterium]|nr:nitronate monooxygenase [Bacteroidales bacterium]
MERLSIGNLTAENCIIQGGMGVGISMSGLASAVANQGGIGVIATVGLGLLSNERQKGYRRGSIESLKEEIRKARRSTRGILGVNIMGALTNYADLVKTSIAEKIDVIFTGAGLPLELPGYLNGSSGTKLVPIVSSVRAAKIIFSKWLRNYNYIPDAVVVEGPKAGGHLGFKADQIHKQEFQLEDLLPDVRQLVDEYEANYEKKIPVIAAGGIYTGRDLLRFHKLGADGIQMGTRFVTTYECDASESFKNAYVNAEKKDIVIIKSPVGMPGRAINNTFIEQTSEGKQIPTRCMHHCLKSCNYKTTPYCIADALVNAQKGNLEGGFAFAGSNAYKNTHIVSVEQVFSALEEEYQDALNTSQYQTELNENTE